MKFKPFFNALIFLCFSNPTYALANTANTNDDDSDHLIWDVSNHSDEVQKYYELHQETYLDRFMRQVASSLGVIVHGNLDQDQLKQEIERFDIARLVSEGPYKSDVLSYEAQQLIYDSIKDYDRIIDTHIHNLGYDEGNYVNPRSSVRGVAATSDYFTFMVMRYAAGMGSPIGSTNEARKRIHLYAQNFPKLYAFILPIHPSILRDGTIDWENTGNYLTNHSALLTSKDFYSSQSQLFPAVSVHPFEKNWKSKLQAAHEKGIRLIKWMPPQSIPPDSDLLDDYYVTIRDLGMTLIAHSGPEHTIPSHEGNKEWYDYGNPLRFRKPLQIGVNVILAHAGHHDLIPDLDDPSHTLVPGNQLFLRLAKETHQKNLTGEWKGKLFGDLAAVTTHYGVDFIRELLLNANEEGVRLFYGSDYPFTNLVKPRSDAFVITAEANLLDPNKVEPLKEIRNWNPLLANYVFTKNLELVKENGEKIKFPDSTFTGRFEDAPLNLIDQELWEDYLSKNKTAP